MSGPIPAPPRRRRRWFSLSLRALLLLILVVGGLMGWKARRASLQRRAVARIERLGGSVEYDWQPKRRPFFAPPVTTGPKAPGWLRRMLGDEYFQEVTRVTLPDIMKDGEIPIPPSLPHDAPRDGPEWQAHNEWWRVRKEAEEALAKDHLACLEGLGQLETLDYSGPPLNSEGITRLGRLSSLKEFNSGFVPLDTEGLAQLAKLSRLERIYITLRLEDDSRLALLERLPKLKILSIFGASMPASTNLPLGNGGPSMMPTKVTDAWLARLGRLGQLTALLVDGPEITDAGLAHLKGLRRLESLSLNRSIHITDAGLVHLKSLRRLESLSLDRSIHITDAGLVHLKGLSNLKRLSLDSSSGLTDAGLAHLAGLKKLYWLSMKSAVNVTDAGMAHLAGLADLELLELDAKPLTDAGLSRLKCLTKLKVLRISGENVSPQALDDLMVAVPGLEIRTAQSEAAMSPGVSPFTLDKPAVPQN